MDSCLSLESIGVIDFPEIQKKILSKKQAKLSYLDQEMLDGCICPYCLDRLDVISQNEVTCDHCFRDFTRKADKNWICNS